MRPPETQRRPGQGAAAMITGNEIAAEHSFPARRAQHLRLSPRVRHLTRRLHRLGDRPVGELLLELIEYHGIEADVVARLEKFAEIDERLLDPFGGRRWPPAPIARVA
jgi:hypothetical protein